MHQQLPMLRLVAFYLIQEQVKPDAKPSRGKSAKRNTSAKSPATAESAVKKKDRKKSELPEPEESEEVLPPPPILLRVRVDLHRWMTASDSLKPPGS